ncbi:hypothetical protein [Saccharothrix australiensis]|uniref:Uncharacterized protein n=1 Tax=Saccharothrix australiensis TaxID=2072 RepID=A0A495VJB2_9PSEU|nr:hypothetical protein [Saccharothrix australiensis]RKT49275.1 hypothetical protein C8E97_6771 [Saccharothrix australiensis]RKT49374.1 hypothetical protein C8E97_6753 [Saccharothrix australiensis]
MGDERDEWEAWWVEQALRGIVRDLSTDPGRVERGTGCPVDAAKNKDKDDTDRPGK